MTLNPSSALLAWGILQIGICLACLAINVISLKDAWRTRRHVIETKENHGADVYSLMTVRGRLAFVAVQLVNLLICAEATIVTTAIDDVPHCCRLATFGIARIIVSLLVAWAAWSNMRAYRGLRDED